MPKYEDMEPYQQRVVDEEAQVAGWLFETDTRADALEAFMDGDIWPTLPDRERALRVEQLRCMRNMSARGREYAKVLGQVVELF